MKAAHLAFGRSKNWRHKIEGERFQSFDGIASCPPRDVVAVSYSLP